MKVKKMAKNKVDKDSPDYQFGVVLTKLESLDEKIDAMDCKYMWAAGIIAFCVSTCVAVIAIFIGK